MYHCTTTRPALQARISADANVNIPNVLSLTQHHRSRSLAGVVLGPVGLRGGATPKTRALPEDKEQGSRGSEAEQMMKSSRKTLSSLDSLLGIPGR